MDIKKLEEIAKLLRYYILTSTTQAGSGHPTSSMSSADIMTTLFAEGYFKYNIKDPKYKNNDRLIFSKGHASPLFYSLWALSGGISRDELMTLRKFNSRLEGHPTPNFPFTEAATGSLGQGLSIGAGMALNAKYLDKLPYKTFVLLGDGELMEGSNWEAAEFSSYYKLDNLIAIVDVNRLEQTETTMRQWDLENYQKKFEAFGWDTFIFDGHDFNAIKKALEKINTPNNKPLVLLAKTIKGKGISFMEDIISWHGKTLNQDELARALLELGEVNKEIELKLTFREEISSNTNDEYLSNKADSIILTPYEIGQLIATRKAYGNVLVHLEKEFPNLIVMDAGTQNSTFSETFLKYKPEKFFSMFIAEQNMVSVALGLSKRNKIPFISTFAAFFSRAFDQIRMSQYSESNIKFIGSHCGVSIGEDGSSQMALEDISMFRTLHNSIVLYPSDAVSTEKLVHQAAKHFGNVYIRTTRMDTPVIYDGNEEFNIGGSKIIKESVYDVLTVVGAGITLHQALRAYDELAKENISIRVVDLYSIKPLDIKTLVKCIRETKAIIVVEDHYPEGGICEAVRSGLENTKTKIYSMAINKLPRSGKPEELLDYEEISYKSIIAFVKNILNNQNY